MYKQYKISVIMPCRNEGAHLSQTVKRVPKFVDEIIIVSNKSTDNTVEVAKSLGLRVIVDDRTIKNIGYGFAHMSGIAAAKGDIIAGIDGDATYPIEDLGAIIEYLIKNKLDFISCNRYPLRHNTSRIPFKLRFGVRILNIETRILYGLNIKDILSGMWIFKKDIRTSLNLSMGDWNLSPEIKINAATNKKIRFREYNIAQHVRKGETKQRYFSTGVSHALWLLSNRIEENVYILRFIVVGTVGFLFNFSLLSAFTHFGINKVFSEAIAIAISLQLTFVLHDNWTYRHHKSNKAYLMHIRKRYSSYLVSNSAGSILTIVIFALLSQALPKLTALAIAAIISMVWNFSINKLLIWRKAKDLIIEKLAEDSYGIEELDN